MEICLAAIRGWQLRDDAEKLLKIIDWERHLHDEMIALMPRALGFTWWGATMQERWFALSSATDASGRDPLFNLAAKIISRLRSSPAPPTTTQSHTIRHGFRYVYSLG
jgi:hypothetical protein